MIWYLGLIISALLSFALALRSMKDFQEDPGISKNDYGLFLIRQSDQLTLELFASLISALKGYICSIEILYKGSSQAMVIYMPHFITSQFPSLGLIEIEDYILGRGQTQEDPFVLSRQITVDDSFTWKVQSKKKTEHLLSKHNFSIELEPDQYFAWQIVFEPGDEKIQLTPRVIIKEAEPQKKIALIKKAKEQINLKTSLTSSQSLLHSGIYEEYKKRALVPKQVQPFLVEKTELLKFILA